MPRSDLLKEQNIPEGGELSAFAHPGGYPVYYITRDGGKLCPDCANGKNGSEAANPECQDDPQWELVGSEVNYEDATLVCAHCEAEIPAAYEMADPAETGECPDCDATINQLHDHGCDQEQCPVCGLQLISCMHSSEDFPDEQRMPWTGKYRGVEDAERLGLWAKMVPGLKGWQPCDKDDEGAIPDLNRLLAFCVWDSASRRFDAPRDSKTLLPLPIPTFPVEPL